MILINEYKEKILKKPSGIIFLICNIIHYLTIYYVLLYPLLFNNKYGDNFYMIYLLLEDQHFLRFQLRY